MPMTTARQLTNTALLRDKSFTEPVHSDRPYGRSSSKRTKPQGRRGCRQWRNCACGALARMPLWRTGPSSHHYPSYLQERRERRDVKDLLDDERGEQREQIEDGDPEQSPRIRLTLLVALNCDAHASDRKPAAHRHVGGEIKRPGESERNGQKPAQHDERGVDHDLTARLRLALHHGQHRYARPRVVAGAIERQRPEMRRRPEEDDGDEHERLDRNA